MAGLTDEWKTLRQWIYFATEGSLVENRKEASNVLLEIARRHAAFTQLLTDEEQELIRGEALSLLSKKDGDPVRVLEILGPVADYSCRQRIVGMIKHRSPQVRLAAIKALGNVADDSCVDDLAEVIRRDDQQENQLAAVTMLSSMGTPRAQAELKRLSKQRLQSKTQDAIKAAVDRLP